MATSGTIGQTTISTDKLLEHAWRRCGLLASSQTPEQVDAAKESLYMLLVHLANRGLNLWCVDKHYIPLFTGQRSYSLPDGSLSVLNVLHSKPTTISGSDTSTASTYTYAFTTEDTLVRFGLELASAPNGPVTIAVSDDDVTYTTIKTIALADAPTALAWFDVDPQRTTSYVKVTDTGGSPALSVATFYAANGGTDVPVSQFNRDEYAQQPDKDFQSGTVTNYFFEKSLSPTVSAWPVPNADGNFLTVWLHRQVQDVGALSQELGIPSRWLESISNQLAFRVALEVPGVDPARLSLLKGLSDESVITAEMDETDGAPIMIQPNIGVYTR